MKFASVRELSQNPSRYVDRKEPIIITRHGKPVRALVSMDEDELEDFILARHMGLDREAERALRLSEKRRNIPSSRLRSRFLKKARP